MPSTLDPATTTILRVTSRGESVRVTTAERPRPWEADEYEDRLRIIGGEWRLEDRRTRGFDGRGWIRFVP